MAAVAGCGGGGPYVRDGATLADCLAARGLKVSTEKDDLDLTAQDAANGGILVTWPRNTANVSVERTPDDAKRDQQGDAMLGEVLGEALSGEKVDAADLQRIRGNVYVLYEHSPAEVEWQPFVGCIKE